MTRNVKIFSTTKDGSIKEEIIINVYSPNMQIDDELLDLLVKYMVRSGGMYWHYEIFLTHTQDIMPKMKLDKKK